MIYIALTLSIITLLFVLGMSVWLIFFHKWIINELKKKLHLAPGEQLKVVQLKFAGNVMVTRADTGEPMDVVYLVEYSNNQRSSNG